MRWVSGVCLLIIMLCLVLLAIAEFPVTVWTGLVLLEAFTIARIDEFMEESDERKKKNS